MIVDVPAAGGEGTTAAARAGVGAAAAGVKGGF